MKLYVITRADLSKSQQAVQAGHAIAEYLLRTENQKGWNNGTLVYLKVPNLDSLWSLRASFPDTLEVAELVEPDRDYELTAIACVDDPGKFRYLRLV